MEQPANKWGDMIEKTVNFGREDKSSKCAKIDPKDSKYDEFRHCSHVLIYAKTNSEFETFQKKAIILVCQCADVIVLHTNVIVHCLICTSKNHFAPVLKKNTFFNMTLLTFCKQKVMKYITPV